jgi:hypothetical protein
LHSSTRISRDIAFIACGLFMVRTAMPPETSVSKTGSELVDIGDAP